MATFSAMYKLLNLDSRLLPMGAWTPLVAAVVVTGDSVWSFLGVLVIRGWLTANYHTVWKSTGVTIRRDRHGGDLSLGGKLASLGSLFGLAWQIGSCWHAGGLNILGIHGYGVRGDPSAAKWPVQAAHSNFPRFAEHFGCRRFLFWSDPPTIKRGNAFFVFLSACRISIVIIEVWFPEGRSG